MSRTHQRIGVFGSLSAPVTLGVARDAGGRAHLVGQLASAGDDGRPRARVVNVGDSKLGYILKLIRDGSLAPRVIEMARRIVADVRDKDEAGEIRAVWRWLVDNVRYVKDPVGREVIQTARRMLTPEEVLPPELAARVPAPIMTGDCDEMGAVLAGALLRAIGYPVRIALWRRPEGPWQHIFVLAYAPKLRKWYPVDPTEKTKPFGWLPPFGKWTAYRLPDDSIAEDRIGVGELGSFLDDIGKAFSSIAGNIGGVVKQALPAVAGAAATLIPGVGPILAPMASNLVNSLVNRGENNPAAMQVVQQVQQGANPIQALTQAYGSQIPGVGSIAQNVIGRWMPQMQAALPPQVQQMLPPQVQQAFAQGDPQAAAQWMRNVSPQAASQWIQQQAPQFAPQVQQQAQQFGPQFAAQAMAQHPQVQRFAPQADPRTLQQQFFQAQQFQAPPQPFPQQQQAFQQQHPQQAQAMFPSPVPPQFQQQFFPQQQSFQQHQPFPQQSSQPRRFAGGDADAGHLDDAADVAAGLAGVHRIFRAVAAARPHALTG